MVRDIRPNPTYEGPMTYAAQFPCWAPTGDYRFCMKKTTMSCVLQRRWEYYTVDPDADRPFPQCNKEEWRDVEEFVET